MCCLRQAIFNDFIIFIFTLSFFCPESIFYTILYFICCTVFQTIQNVIYVKKNTLLIATIVYVFFVFQYSEKMLYETYRFVIALFRYIPRRTDSWKTFYFQLYQKSLWKILTSISSTKVLNQIKPIHSFAKQLHGFWENSTETVVVGKVFLETPLIIEGQGRGNLSL